MTWKLEVDARACVASGLCTGIAPDHFVLEGRAAVPRNPEIEPDEDVLDAANGCPGMAIAVTEDGRDLLE
ncbi:ferredoxin [Actinokineospora sp. HUAS TT18]|uniref:ferredoxin n=1 Tax=Actinokineospora sp. HUAS TT18 TaxID=3447451 RepID=UPI003F5220A5